MKMTGLEQLSLDCNKILESLDDALDACPSRLILVRQNLKAARAGVRELSASILKLNSKDRWIPASRAVKFFKRLRHGITLKWVTHDAWKHGVLTRPRVSPGRHKVEVHLNTLAGYVFLVAYRQALKEEPETD